jgi:hypothetical protein
VPATNGENNHGDKMTRSTLARFTFSLLACSACAPADDAASGDGVGTAEANILLAPTDVRCIVIQVQGSATVTQQFNVSPQGNSAFTLSGLPVGNDTFTAQAFGVACSAVAGATATYVSPSQMATITAATPASLTFQMTPAGPPSGSSMVNVNFTPPAHGTVTEFPIAGPTATTMSNPRALAVGADGNLWVS